MLRFVYHGRLGGPLCVPPKPFGQDFWDPTTPLKRRDMARGYSGYHYVTVDVLLVVWAKRRGGGCHLKWRPEPPPWEQYWPPKTCKRECACKKLPPLLRP